MGRTNLIAIEGGAFNAFIHCTLRNAGNYAGGVGGVSNGVSSCTILPTRAMAGSITRRCGSRCARISRGC